MKLVGTLVRGIKFLIATESIALLALLLSSSLLVSVSEDLLMGAAF